jgi:hypothetical protein
VVCWHPTAALLCPCHTRIKQPAGARDQSVFDKDKSVFRTGTDVSPIRKWNPLLK